MTNKNDKKPATLTDLIDRHAQLMASHNAACKTTDELEISLTWTDNPALTPEQAASIKASIRTRNTLGTAERKALQAVCLFPGTTMDEIAAKASYLSQLAGRDVLAIETYHFWSMLLSMTGKAETPAKKVSRLAHELSQALDTYQGGEWSMKVFPASNPYGPFMFMNITQKAEVA